MSCRTCTLFGSPEPKKRRVRPPKSTGNNSSAGGKASSNYNVKAEATSKPKANKDQPTATDDTDEEDEEDDNGDEDEKKGTIDPQHEPKLTASPPPARKHVQEDSASKDAREAWTSESERSTKSTIAPPKMATTSAGTVPNGKSHRRHRSRSGSRGGGGSGGSSGSSRGGSDSSVSHHARTRTRSRSGSSDHARSHSGGGKGLITVDISSPSNAVVATYPVSLSSPLDVAKGAVDAAASTTVVQPPNTISVAPPVASPQSMKGNGITIYGANGTPMNMNGNNGALTCVVTDQGMVMVASAGPAVNYSVVDGNVPTIGVFGQPQSPYMARASNVTPLRDDGTPMSLSIMVPEPPQSQVRIIGPNGVPLPYIPPAVATTKNGTASRSRQASQIGGPPQNQSMFIQSLGQGNGGIADAGPESKWESSLFDCDEFVDPLHDEGTVFPTFCPFAVLLPCCVFGQNCTMLQNEDFCCSSWWACREITKLGPWGCCMCTTGMTSLTLQRSISMRTHVSLYRWCSSINGTVTSITILPHPNNDTTISDYEEI
jgi:hypothetical protein